MSSCFMPFPTWRSGWGSISGIIGSHRSWRDCERNSARGISGTGFASCGSPRISVKISLSPGGHSDSQTLFSGSGRRPLSEQDRQDTITTPTSRYGNPPIR